MQVHKILLLLFLSFFGTCKLFAQTGTLRLTVYHEVYTETPCFELKVYHQTDTVHSRKFQDDEEISIDSLAIGSYSVNVTYCGTPSDEVVQSMTQTFEIKDSQITQLRFDFTQYTTYEDTDTLDMSDFVTLRTEIQFAFSYFDFRWNPDGNNPKFNVGIDYSFYNWMSFSKHFGFLFGGGMGYMFAPLQIDSDDIALYQEEIKSQYYNYFTLQYDMKLRFTTLNQQSDDLRAHSVNIDIGTVYNIPLYFRRITRFNIQDKFVNGYIHSFADLRFYVNIGFTNVQLFASYRPFDFVRGDFQELPKYNAGMKFNVNFE